MQQTVPGEELKKGAGVRGWTERTSEKGGGTVTEHPMTPDDTLLIEPTLSSALDTYNLQSNIRS